MRPCRAWRCDARLEDRPAPWRRARDSGSRHCRARPALGRGLRAGDCPSQFVIGRMARSGGDREIRGGPGRVAHRLRAQSGGLLLFRPVGRDAGLRHRLDRFGEPARMIERMHGAREPGVAFVGRRRVALGQKIARLPHAVRRLSQASHHRGPGGPLRLRPRPRVRLRSRRKAFRAPARSSGAPPRPRPSASEAKPDRGIW